MKKVTGNDSDQAIDSKDKIIKVSKNDLPMKKKKIKENKII